MQAKWVIGQFTGAQAQSVKSHADAGIGYHLRSVSGAGNSLSVQAAFLRAEDGEPKPEHLEYATIDQVEKLEKLRGIRGGTYKRPNNITSQS